MLLSAAEFAALTPWERRAAIEQAAYRAAVRTGLNRAARRRLARGSK